MWYIAVHEDAAFVMSQNLNNSIYDGEGNEWFKDIADTTELAQVNRLIHHVLGRGLGLEMIQPTQIYYYIFNH